MSPDRTRWPDTMPGAQLKPGETVVVLVQADGAKLAVTTDRLLVANDDRVLLDVGLFELRRLQLDIESGRPGSLGVVPESAAKEPQILNVMPDAYDDVSRAMAFVGHELARRSGV